MPASHTNRREFLKTGLAATVTAAGARAAFAKPTDLGPNEKFVIGMVGTGGRGTWLLREVFANRKDVEIAYLCDVDEKRLAGGVKAVVDAGRPAPKTVVDYRNILDDKSVDILVNATPDHWHVLPSLHACQAGKDVYVEKPASHNIWEGRKLVEAARKYKRIVQLGTQTRSGPYTIAAREFLASGGIGDIHFARVLNMKRREPMKPQPDSDVPEGVDYDRWLGAAPDRRFNPNRFHYNWHWFWDYSGGDIINDGVHQIDAARYLIGKDYPNAVWCSGAKVPKDNIADSPDTQVVSWEFDDIIMTFELSLWTPHMQKTPWDFRDTDGFPNWQTSATQVEIHGTKGLMKFSRHGGGWQAWNPDGKEIANHPGRHPHPPHVDNFFECIKTRKKPNAEIEEGHLSTNLCHLGNISHRVGGRKLVYDGKTETFPGDNEANALLKREYRTAYAVPENV